MKSKFNSIKKLRKSSSRLISSWPGLERVASECEGFELLCQRAIIDYKLWASSDCGVSRDNFSLSQGFLNAKCLQLVVTFIQLLDVNQVNHYSSNQSLDHKLFMGFAGHLLVVF
jgi:hypothetical protein